MSRRPTFAIFLLVFAACDSRLETAAPAVVSLAPQVVCNTQLTTRIALTGRNLAPVPMRALSGLDDPAAPPALRFPALRLVRTDGLAGGAIGEAPVDIPDDDARPDQSHVRWQSDASMSFDVFPELKLRPGVYEVQAENPDGSTAALARALAVVEAPVATGVAPASICDAQADQVLALTGRNFLRLGVVMPTVKITPVGGGTTKTYTPIQATGCVDVATPVMSGLKLCDGLSFMVKQNDLAPGPYDVTVTNPVPAYCTSTDPIKLSVAAPPKVVGAVPASICLGGGAFDVTGSGFVDPAQVAVGGVSASAVKFVASDRLTATFGGLGSTFLAGTKYDLTVTNPDGCRDSMAMAVTAAPSPLLWYADPPSVSNTITTPVTIYAAVSQPVQWVTISPVAGGPPVPLKTAVDPMHPTRIVVYVPKDTAPGRYDFTVSDATTCSTVLAAAVTVTDSAAFALTGIDPTFGWQGTPTAVTITAPGGLQATPRAYLAPHNAGPGSVATALGSVRFVSDTTVAAVVPSGVDPAVGPYDVVVVNPDGRVGRLAMPIDALYRSTAEKSPVIDAISPAGLPAIAPPPLTILGANFRQPRVDLICITDLKNGTRTTLSAPVAVADAASILINAPPLDNVPAPSLCTVRVTNSDDRSFAEYSALAVADPNAALSPSTAGAALPVPRRAPIALVGLPNGRDRFLYVVGGDNGQTVGAFGSVLGIAIGEDGTHGSWSVQRYGLNQPRTLAGGASFGRYLYVVGGNDGARPVASVERAMLLDPQQAPVVQDPDVVPGGAPGLSPGTWHYRVSALMDSLDPDNPGGETLASDSVGIRIAAVPQKMQAVLTWSAVPGAVGYRIYRTPQADLAVGQEQLLADLPSGNARNFQDIGGPTVGGSPLPLGSAGKWRVLPAMASRRESPAAAIVRDPSDPMKRYLYATLGRDAGPLDTFEFLPIGIGANGQQSVANTWVTGSAKVATARYQHAIHAVDHDTSPSVVPGAAYVWLGGGTANGRDPLAVLEVARVQPGGQLGAFSSSAATIGSFGMGAAVGGSGLYTFGDQVPSNRIRAGRIAPGDPPGVAAFTALGGVLRAPRYLPGAASAGALFFLVGGSDLGANGAASSVEWMIW